MLQMADYDATRERLRRPKPTNPYYDGPVGCLQQSTAARPFINDPDPDHPSFTASRLRRSPILCAKQKRGMQTPLPYSLPSFGPAGGQPPRHGHGKQPQQAPCPGRASLDRAAGPLNAMSGPPTQGHETS